MCSTLLNLSNVLFLLRKPMGKEICLSVKNPVKISVSLRPDLLAGLKEKAAFEGRSLSNLCAFLLEGAYKDAVDERRQPTYRATD